MPQLALTGNSVSPTTVHAHLTGWLKSQSSLASRKRSTKPENAVNVKFGNSTMPKRTGLIAFPAMRVIIPYSSASGECEVSRLPIIATSATPAAPTRYHAGASLLPVAPISHVATSGAVPPNTAFAALKQNAKPL